MELWDQIHRTDKLSQYSIVYSHTKPAELLWTFFGLVFLLVQNSKCREWSWSRPYFFFQSTCIPSRKNSSYNVSPVVKFDAFLYRFYFFKVSQFSLSVLVLWGSIFIFKKHRRPHWAVDYVYCYYSNLYVYHRPTLLFLMQYWPLCKWLI